jgi:hypothetical protein
MGGMVVTHDEQQVRAVGHAAPFEIAVEPRLNEAVDRIVRSPFIERVRRSRPVG